MAPVIAVILYTLAGFVPALACILIAAKKLEA
jgi:hypothetical protein